MPDEDLPRGWLQQRMLDPEVQAEVRRSDVVLGVNARTGEPAGVFYGIAALKRIMRRGETKQLRVMELPIDSDTDDIEAAIALVTTVKGAHCYGTGP
jgi:hypothetical protein